MRTDMNTPVCINQNAAGDIWLQEPHGGFILKFEPQVTESQAIDLAGKINSFPDLLAALEGLLQMHNDSVFVCGSDDQDMVDGAVNKAAAAILKAKGGQS